MPLPESALPGAETGLLGRVVEQIRVIVEGGQQSGWLKEIPLKQGDRLERDKVRESLRVLYRSGRFAEVQADATVLPSGGVALEFRSKPNYFNGNVTVTGLPKSGLSDSEVAGAAGLDLGAEFREEKLKDAENRILRLLQDEGYWAAKVDAKLARHEETQQMDVEFQVTPGTRARVGKLTVTGDPSLTSAEAMAICGMQPGARLRRDAAAARGVAAAQAVYAPAPAGGAADGGGTRLLPGEQHGGFQHRGGARTGGGGSRGGPEAEPRNAEALRAGVGRARGGRGPAERRTAQPARLSAGSGIL